MARLSRANMRGANLDDARLGPPEPGNELKTPQQTDLAGANLGRREPAASRHAPSEPGVR